MGEAVLPLEGWGGGKVIASFALLLLLSWALLSLFVVVDYHRAAISAHAAERWLPYIISLATLLTGWGFIGVKSRMPWLDAILSLTILLVIFIPVSLFVGLYTACAMGDCL